RRHFCSTTPAPTAMFPLSLHDALPICDMDAMFELIRQGDVLLHHPYDGFTPVLELIRQAAEDPDVLAIKQTLYRTGRESPIVEQDRKSTRLNSSHVKISYAVFCLKKKK